MGQFYPTASLHMAMMESQAREAERRALEDSLLAQAALARLRSRTPRGSMVLFRLSRTMVAWGARLVQFGLPPYEPSASHVALSSN